MGKRLALFLMIGVMILGALAACGGAAPEEPAGGESPAAPAESPAAPAESPAAPTGGAESPAAPAGGGAAVTEAEVDATEMAFSPAAITAPANSTLTITLKNSGGVLHDLTIDKDGAGQKIVATADPGAEEKVEVATGAAGSTMEFYCAQPGHKDAGMVGTITVQ